jgi:cytochrome c-type biogenesis protein CcmH/NrfG
MWLRGEFGEVIRLNPTNAAAHANLGLIAFGQNRYAQAKAAFQAAL